MRSNPLTALEAFKIPSRGTIICADFEGVADQFAVGDTIEIVLRSGDVVRTRIAGRDLFRGTFEKKVGGILIAEEMLPEALDQAQVFKIIPDATRA